MATYQKAGPEVAEIVRSVIEEFHPDLLEAHATIGVVMAHATLDESGEAKGPAIRKNGRQVYGMIRKNREADRVDGKPDATITLDADHWDTLDRAGRRAEIDGHLYCLIVRREEPAGGGRSRIKTDDHGRPLFSIRPYDWVLTGFRAVAERHGPASLEVREATEWRAQFGQLLFGFAGPPAPPLPGIDADAPRPRRARKAGSVAAANR